MNTYNQTMNDNMDNAKIMGSRIDWEVTGTKNVNRELNEKFINLQSKYNQGIYLSANSTVNSRKIGNLQSKDS